MSGQPWPISPPTKHPNPQNLLSPPPRTSNTDRKCGEDNPKQLKVKLIPIGDILNADTAERTVNVDFVKEFVSEYDFDNPEGMQSPATMICRVLMMQIGGSSDDCTSLLWLNNVYAFSSTDDVAMLGTASRGQELQGKLQLLKAVYVDDANPYSARSDSRRL